MRATIPSAVPNSQFPLLLAFLGLSLLANDLAAQATRVLFLGNSYTYVNDLPGLFTQLAASMGETVETGEVTPGGYTFQMHSTFIPSLDAIAQGNWDVIVLQEQSQLPSFPPAQVEVQCFPYATQLAELVRGANACAEVVYLMTWGRENGDASNCPNYPPLCTYSGMQQRLRDSYVQMAEDNSAWCAPAGITWQVVRNDHPEIALYASDGSHPLLAGSYVAASTLASTLFRRSCAGATFVPNGLAPLQAQQIRAIASAVVLDSLDTWNIGVNDPSAAIAVQDLGGGQFLFTHTGSPVDFFQWDLGDGTTSNDADPLHAYGSEGLYTVTLTVIDDCGRSDSTAMAVAVLSSGLGHMPGVQLARLFLEDTGIRVNGLQDPALLDLLDPAGRLIARHGLSGSSTQRIPLPPGVTGLLLWQLVQPDGQRSTGRLLLP